MEPICRDRIASARLMREYGLDSEGAKRLFSLKNCAMASDCRHRDVCRDLLETVWQVKNPPDGFLSSPS
ncbi:MAG: hypothetical protein CMI60_05015 [Parvibaculum sp.]|nr:hypothetical protein [Parvibaculum sp.]